MFDPNSGQVQARVPLGTQAKLLRAIEQKEVQPVGAAEPVGDAVDVLVGRLRRKLCPRGTQELIVELHLTEPSLLEFTATAFAPDPVCASATMWVLPSMQLLADPGLVLTIAGLYTTVTASVANQTVTIQANVTMMCGCPITLQPPPAPPPPGEAPPEPYWPSGEFEVTAQIRANGGLDVLSFPLTCSGTSTFKGSLDLKPGTYDLWVVAVQPAETNVGFARATVVVP